MAPRFRIGRVGFSLALGVCFPLGCASGPSDTTNTLTVNAVTTPTNQPTQVISGTTDPSSNITAIVSDTDTVTAVANDQGAFGFTATLVQNSNTLIVITSVDPPGNQASEMVTILHDDILPSLTMSSPSTVTPTAGQSAFEISVAWSDAGSGVDTESFQISNNLAIGGVFKPDGSFSTTIDANQDLTPVFSSINVTGANYTVADTLIFPAGSNTLSASVTDEAGNVANLTRRFDVTGDPVALIIVDAQGGQGDTILVQVGLANTQAIAGVQFDLTYDTAVVDTLFDAGIGARTLAFSAPAFNQIAADRARVLLFDLGGQTIAPGQGVVAELQIILDVGAPLGDHSLSFEANVASAPGGSSDSVPDATGRLTVQ